MPRPPFLRAALVAVGVTPAGGVCRPVLSEPGTTVAAPGGSGDRAGVRIPPAAGLVVLLPGLLLRPALPRAAANEKRAPLPPPVVGIDVSGGGWAVEADGDVPARCCAEAVVVMVRVGVASGLAGDVVSPTRGDGPARGPTGSGEPVGAGCETAGGGRAAEVMTKRVRVLSKSKGTPVGMAVMTCATASCRQNRISKKLGKCEEGD